MAGVARATREAQQCILIFDQYFWSAPYARMLNWRLSQVPSLRVIVVLPPWADSGEAIVHRARRNRLNVLVEGMTDSDQRVRVYNLWDPRGPGRAIYCHAKVQTYDGSLFVCGSANLNRRSFNCDTELACAVLDQVATREHQRRLWRLLFRDVPAPVGSWPALDLNAAGNGAKFFDAFVAAAADPKAYVRPDPWRDHPPRLVNGAERPVASKDSWQFNFAYEPSSIDLAVEQNVRTTEDGQKVNRPVRLDDIVDLIEKVEKPGRFSKEPKTPWRHN